jgi:hypothetical protein
MAVSLNAPRRAQQGVPVEGLRQRIDIDPVF